MPGWLALSRLGGVKKGDILSVEEDETHMQVARNLNQTVGDFGKSILPDF
ncbi:hypothetical protein [Anabaena lutea]|uniref:Uncharacterized protein n=1 Tax=Anabaena lutea FACHB-196 TaxID=2692881 RepID=A0ABR8FK86_9NOST|nr:hypothetical protein [Anabaena lutea]MBD2570627.1 hypothetical protein [Anabaena lutea FACHB-196]